jgi:hypothetical protein
MITPLPCIIFKSISKFIPESYDVGWLVAEKEPRILVWGNTKNKETAGLLCNNLIKDRGERLVILYDKEIGRNKVRLLAVMEISAEELDDILTGKDTEILYQYP